jgi:hypothetical protein
VVEQVAEAAAVVRDCRDNVAAADVVLGQLAGVPHHGTWPSGLPLVMRSLVSIATDAKRLLVHSPSDLDGLGHDYRPDCQAAVRLRPLVGRPRQPPPMLHLPHTLATDSCMGS